MSLPKILPKILCLVLCLVLALVVSGCSSDSSIDPPDAGQTASADAGRNAAAAILRLEQALRDADAAAAAALGSGGAKSILGAAAANVRALDIDDLALRFIDDNGLGADDLAAYGTDAWRGTVEIRYRIDGWDAEPASLETPMVFVPGGDGALIAAIGGDGGRTPLWLRGPLSVRSSSRALVLDRTGDPASYLALARNAVLDVTRVLPDWTGRLVLEIPGSEEELDQALDAPPEQYANIAAVTAAVDGSLNPGTPVHVFLNPRVFDGLGPRGAQVVVSHETTHVAKDATFAQMPIWLLEGFADYVALAHAGIPVGTAASQILARVRRQGPPERLPTEADLAPTATGLGATYEEAWLATRFIALRHGEAKLVAFYDAVDGGATAAEAFRRILGTTPAAFLAEWSADVSALAGGEPG